MINKRGKLGNDTIFGLIGIFFLLDAFVFGLINVNKWFEVLVAGIFIFFALNKR